VNVMRFKILYKNTHKSIFQSFILLLVFGLTACGAGSTGDDGSEKIEIPLTSNGGIVEWISPGNSGVKAQLTVPAGALSNDTTITAQAASGSDDAIKFIPGTTLDFGPDGLVFNVPVQLVITYDPAQLNGSPENALTIYKLSNGSWSKLDSTIDIGAHTITADINGFSIFAAGAESVPPTTTASPDGGSFDPDMTPSVVLSCDDSDGSGCDKTYYTIDGSEPTLSSNIYDTPLLIESSSTLKFFSTDVAGNSEEIKQEDYVIETLFSIGGTVTGLTGTAVIENSNGDSKSVTDNGIFAFDIGITNGSDYLVTIQSQPIDQLCSVTNEMGIVNGADVTNIEVTCIHTVPTYSIGGTVNGLTGTLVIKNNNGDSKNITVNGEFSFDTEVVDTTDYLVTIENQPDNQICSVINESGTVAGSDVISIEVACVSTYAIGGTVTGLTGTLVINNSNGDSESITDNGVFAFDTRVINSTDYLVTITSQPNNQECSLTNETGTVNGANVVDVQVICLSPPGWVHPADENSYINPEGAGGSVVMAMNNNGQAIAA